VNYKNELIEYINNLSEQETKLLYIKLKHGITLDDSELTKEEKEIIKKAEKEIQENKINKLEVEE
jgi:hypothetical protein